MRQLFTYVVSTCRKWGATKLSILQNVERKELKRHFKIKLGITNGNVRRVYTSEVTVFAFPYRTVQKRQFCQLTVACEKKLAISTEAHGPDTNTWVWFVVVWLT